MTELEKHLLAGFDKLSKQYESEQKQQAEQISSLSQQVLDLSKRVEDLTKLHSDSEAILRQDLEKVFNSLSEQLKQLSES